MARDARRPPLPVAGGAVTDLLCALAAILGALAGRRWRAADDAATTYRRSSAGMSAG